MLWGAQRQSLIGRVCSIHVITYVVTYAHTHAHSELLEMTCRVANALKADGVKKGDRVAIYMPMSPLLVAAMLACARIGAVHRLGKSHLVLQN